MLLLFFFIFFLTSNRIFSHFLSITLIRFGFNLTLLFNHIKMVFCLFLMLYSLLGFTSSNFDSFFELKINIWVLQKLFPININTVILSVFIFKKVSLLTIMLAVKVFIQFWYTSLHFPVAYSTELVSFSSSFEG